MTKMEEPMTGWSEFESNVRAAIDAELEGRDDLARVRARLLERRVDHRRPHSQRYRWGLAAVATGTAVVGLTALVLVGGDESTFLEIALPPTPTTTSLRVEAAEQPTGLSFSDGSRIHLHHRSAARLTRIAAPGAAIRLERGSMEVDIAPRKGNDWEFAAGPHVVRVLGTRFTIRWSPASKVLDVDVHRGEVRVETEDQPFRTLTEGQALRLTERERPAHENEERDREPAPSANRELPSGPPSSVRVDPVRPRKKSSSAAEDLVRADELRLTGDFEAARTIYLAVRRHHPETPDAARAAFMLGRLAADRGAPDEATGWLEHYVDEAPDGRFTNSALGRLMEIYETLQDTDGVHRAARRYLARDADGPYADAARRALGR